MKFGPAVGVPMGMQERWAKPIVDRMMKKKSASGEKEVLEV